MDTPTPGPGGFAPAGPFAPRPGITLLPAKTRAVIGVGNGSGPPPSHHPPLAAMVFCLAVVVAVVLALVNTVRQKA